MKNLSLLVAISVALALASVAMVSLNSSSSIVVEPTLLEEYVQYAQKYGKVSVTSDQSSEELFYRASIYAEFLQTMKKHNADPSKTWKMGINQFSDITDQEFTQTYLGELPSLSPYEVLQHQIQAKKPINDGFAHEIDWRNRHIITPIRNQGKCGSCWAFAATAAHESYQVQNRHQKVDQINLSEQQLVDCATAAPYQNHGCNGGYAARALEYIKDFGQTTQSEYPYKAVDQECATPSGKFRPYGFAELAGCDEIEYEMQKNPMAVRVDASKWKNYATGILSQCDTKLNHAVFMVGTSNEAWTIKNSWSESWGEKGYIRLAKGNTCGVCIGPSFPV